MRLLLVDDEPVTLRGLSYLIERSFPEHSISGCFQSGLEALEFLERGETDAVITDINMPHIDGIALITRLRERHPGLPVVALSAHSDFGYVRDALTGGALDYMLKPYNEDSLRAVLERVARALGSSRTEYRDKERRVRLHRYLNGLDPASPDLGIAPPYFLGILRLSAAVEADIRGKALDSVMAALPPGTLSAPYLSGTLLLASAADCGADIGARCEGALERMDGMTRSRALLAFFPACLREELASACKTCLDMLRFLRFNRYGPMISDKDFQLLLDRQRTLSLEEHFDLDRIAHQILQEDAPALRNCLSKGWSELCMRYAFFTPEVIRSHISKLLLDLEQLLRRYFDNFILPLPAGWSGSLQSYLEDAGGVDQLGTQFVDYLCGITIDAPGGQPLPRFVLESVRYIDLHYREPITLKSIAQNTYVNNWYLSTQFSKYMKLPVKEYINKVRINHAAMLLQNTDAKVYQVAADTGFHDPAYFSTVFKRFQGMTPKEFQRRIREGGGGKSL